MSLSFAPTDETIRHGRKSAPVPAYVEKAVHAALHAGKCVETTGPVKEVHEAATAFRRFKKEHPELKMSISEREHNDKKTASLLVSVSKAESKDE